MKRSFSKKESLGRGFTLVEMLVAITVLLLAITGPMTIAARGLQSAFFAREQMTAFYLGQEAIELVRLMRDEDALDKTGGTWDWYNINLDSDCKDVGHGCGLDARSSNIRSCATPADCTLLYDTGSIGTDRGMYNYDSGELSSFTRVVTISDAAIDGGQSGVEAVVTAEITWTSALFGGQKSVIVQSRITDPYK